MDSKIHLDYLVVHEDTDQAQYERCARGLVALFYNDEPHRPHCPTRKTFEKIAKFFVPPEKAMRLLVLIQKKTSPEKIIELLGLTHRPLHEVEDELKTKLTRRWYAKQTREYHKPLPLIQPIIQPTVPSPRRGSISEHKIEQLSQSGTVLERHYPSEGLFGSKIMTTANRLSANGDMAGGRETIESITISDKNGHVRHFKKIRCIPGTHSHQLDTDYVARWIEEEKEET
ncbi:MAG: hypothetical protein AAB575_02830 [Patescibacteria group bacterium]